jgi:hypothetical protein
LSDAAESLVNVVAAVSVMVALRLAARGPDFEHPYGHQKAEYLSSVFEATMILLAGGRDRRLRLPAPVGAAAAGERRPGHRRSPLRPRCSTARARRYLLRAGRPWTPRPWWPTGATCSPTCGPRWRAGRRRPGGATGWARLDPLLALVVAAHVAREGVRVLTANLSKLMDERLPAARSRSSSTPWPTTPRVLGLPPAAHPPLGARRFAEVDLFVDPGMSVRAAHEVVAEVEAGCTRASKELTTTMHVEPMVEGLREGHHAPADEFPRHPPLSRSGEG